MQHFALLVSGQESSRSPLLLQDVLLICKRVWDQTCPLCLQYHPRTGSLLPTQGQLVKPYRDWHQSMALWAPLFAPLYLTASCPIPPSKKWVRGQMEQRTWAGKCMGAKTGRKDMAGFALSLSTHLSALSPQQAHRKRAVNKCQKEGSDSS